MGKENDTICFCWFVAQILVECLHLLFWYLNFPLLTVKQRPGVTSTVCYSEGWKQPRHTWMLTSLLLDSQASALGLCSQLGICSSHLAVLSVMSFTLVCKYGLLFSFSTFSKLSVRLTAWKVERWSMERTKTYWYWFMSVSSSLCIIGFPCVT